MQRAPKTEIISLPDGMSEHRRLPAAYIVTNEYVGDECISSLRAEAAGLLSVPIRTIERDDDNLVIYFETMAWPTDDELVDVATLVEENSDAVVLQIEQQHIGEEVR